MKSRIGNLVFIVLGAALLCGSISGCGSKASKATSSAASEQKLLGKWLETASTDGPANSPAHPPQTWEFSAGGKLNLFKTEKNQKLTIAGTYKLEGSQRMTVVLENKLLLTFKFSFPTDNQLYLEELNDKGVVWGTTTFSRANEPPTTIPPK